MPRYWTLLVALAVNACGNDSREWAPAVEVDNTTGIFQSTLTRAGQNSALVVYLRVPEEAFAPFEIVAVWREPSGQWGAPTVVGTEMESFHTPAIAADAAGNAIVAWSKPRFPPEEHEIWASRHVPGIGWAPPEFVGPGGIGINRGPRAALRADGTAVIGWGRYRGPSGSESDTFEVLFRGYVQDEGWALLEPWPLEEPVSIAAIGVDEENRVVAAWFRFPREANAPIIGANRLTPGLGWSEASVFPGESSFFASLDIDRQGTIWAFWQDSDPAVCPVVARNTVDGWTRSELNTTCEEGSGRAALSADDAGGAVAIWSEGLEDPISPYWIHYSEAQGWSAPAPMPLGAGTGGPSYALSTRAGGAAVALWYRNQQDELSRLSVWASELSADGQWSEPQLLESSGPVSGGIAPFSLQPSVAIYPNGRALGSWLRYRGTENPEEFRINDVTPWVSEYR